jgi:hypothetical protein
MTGARPTPNNCPCRPEPEDAPGGDIERSEADAAQGDVEQIATEVGICAQASKQRVNQAEQEICVIKAQGVSHREEVANL